MSEPTNKPNLENNATRLRRTIISKKDLYKFHKSHIGKLHKKYSVNTDTKVQNVNLDLKLNVHKINPNINTSDSENEQFKMANKPDWPELKINSDSENKLKQIYDQPTPSGSNMETEDDYQFPKITAKPQQKKINTTPITNKYGALLHDEPQEENPTPSKVKKQWIPPIIVNTKIYDYKKLIDNITQTLGHKNFSVKLNRNSSKVIVQSNEDHQKLIQDFKNIQLECHTYPRQDEKSKKIVLKAAPGLDTVELHETLKNNNINTKEIIALKGKHTSHSYLITVPKEQQINDIKKINNISNLRVSWERYSRKTDYTQCYRCQSFGHGQTNCFNKPRCVKCPGEHHYRDCTLVRTPESVAYCCNCGGPHTANYSQCPRLLEYLEARNKAQNQSSAKQQNTGASQSQRPKINKIRDGRSYANVTNNTQEHTSEQFSPLLNLMGNETETQEIIKLINLIVTLKNEIRNATSQIEKITIIAKYLDKF